MATSDLFPRAVAIVLTLEGIYGNTPGDPGGETKWGIARNAHPEIPQATWDSFTRDDALSIYRSQYWTPPHCGDMPWPWALAVFDGFVNQGPAVAALAQAALGMQQVDGIIGSLTLDVIASAMPEHLDEFLALRAMRYWNNPNFKLYGNGWIKRLCAIARLGAMPPAL